MIRLNLNTCSVALSAAIATVTLGLAGCGAGGEGSGDDPGAAAGSGGNGVGGAATAGGGTAGTSPGPSGTAGAAVVPGGAGGNPVTPGGAGGAPGPGAGGTPAPAGSGGQGTGVPAGDTWTTASNLDGQGKLIAPAAGQGFQVATPVFDLKPGDEVFKCYHVTIPNTAEFDVGQWESQMTPGSHHFILYREDGDTVPSGTLQNAGCTQGFGGPTWLYTAGTPHAQLPMPDGVAMPLLASQKVVFDMHYINTSTEVIHANVTLNINKVKAAQFERASALVSFNTQIAIPPNGKQTVGGDCTPGPGAKFFVMGTHMHRRGTDATITRVGGAGETLVHTTDWDVPQSVLWEKPPFLTFAAGEKFHYSCSFENDRAAWTTVGSSAATNEMCMAVTYYFPASAGGRCN